MRTFREMGEVGTLLAPQTPVGLPHVLPQLLPINPNLLLSKLLPMHPSRSHHEHLLAANYMFMLGGIPPPLPLPSTLGLPAFELHKAGGPIMHSLHGEMGRENAAPYSLLASPRCLSRLAHPEAAGLLPILPMYHSLPPFMFPSYEALASSSSSSSGSSGIGSMEYSGLAAPYMHGHHPSPLPCCLPFHHPEQQILDRA